VAHSGEWNGEVAQSGEDGGMVKWHAVEKMVEW